MSQIPNTIKDILVRYKIDAMGCWIYGGNINTHGYARAFIGGKKLMAHRVFYEYYVGRIPDGLQIDHLCRVRCCVNPCHLEAVTGRTNILRGKGAAANNANKRSCPKCGGPFTIWKCGRRCKPCLDDRRRKRSPTYEREYRRLHRCKILAYQRTYYRLNRDTIRARQRELWHMRKMAVTNGSGMPCKADQ